MDKRRGKIRIISVFFALLAVSIFTKVVISLVKCKDPSISGKQIIVDEGKNKFEEFSYKTNDIEGRAITLFAQKASEEKKGEYKFDNIKSTFTLSNGESGTIIANKIFAVHNDKTICEFDGDVYLSTSAGLRAKTQKSLIDFNAKTAQGNKRIDISKENTKISADEYNFDLDKNIATLSKNVIGSTGYTNNIKKRLSAQTATVAFDKEYPDSIKAMQLKGKPFLATDDYTLSCDEIISYDNDSISAKSGTILIYKNDNDSVRVKSQHMLAKLKNSKIESVDASGCLVITAKNATIKADRGVLSGGKIRVSGNVMITNEYGDIFGDIADFDLKTRKILLRNSSGILNDGRA